MALIFAALTLLAVCSLCVAFASLGNPLLRALKFQLPAHSDQFVLAVAVGLLTTEVLLFLIQPTGHIRLASWALTAFLGAVLIWQWKWIRTSLGDAFRRFTSGALLQKFLLTAVAAVLFLEFLISQAPLTGSDALNYHFTAQKDILLNGFHPLLSNSHSLLSGQQHLLILFGLALQGDRLALGFIFLGGLLTALALARLILRWASFTAALIFTLLFLLTPVVFWQISSSGAPDIFMAFLACVALIVLCQEQLPPTWQQAAVVGFLVGGIAGSKYTGCLIAVAFLLATALKFRSLVRLFPFVTAALLSGIWLYLRNFLWTGNPVFPFLGARLSPHLVTNFALADLTADTHHVSTLFTFAFFAAAQQNNPGLWDFFGPAVFALAPLVLLARGNRSMRIPLIVWSISGVLLFFASGLPRFLLPVFPVALACVAGGWDAARRQHWKIAVTVASFLLIVLTSAGAAGLATYSTAPLLAALGVISKTQYLEQFSFEYQVIEVVNGLLAAQDPKLRTLVFVRHMYYLEIPFLNGNPATSFEVDPSQLQTTAAWRDFFAKKSIGYVARSPDYPRSIAEPLLQMERDGDLVPIDHAVVESFSGKRQSATSTAITVVILKVKR
jgi:hypothetical protein